MTEHLPQIIISGNSDVGALKLGLDLLKQQKGGDVYRDIQTLAMGPGSLFLGDFFEEREDRIAILNSSFLAAPNDPSHADPVLRSIPLKKHRERWYGFSCFHTHAITLDPELYANHHSVRLLETILFDRRKYTFEFFKLCKSKNLRVFGVATPRAFVNHPRMHKKFLPEIMDIFRFFETRTKERLASMGVPFVEVPPALYDADGFTKSKYKHHLPEDKHHCNQEYGKEMMKHIISEVRRFDA